MALKLLGVKFQCFYSASLGSKADTAPTSSLAFKPRDFLKHGFGSLH